MLCKHWVLVTTLAAVVLLGCKGSEGPDENPQSVQSVDDTGEPARAVAVFLDALRRGDDQKILQMYTALAREQVLRSDVAFAPKASDTATFEVGEVEYLAEDGARVACTWTDLGEDGPQTLEFLWMVRREPAGWRVAGVAAYAYPGEEPLLLDLEKSLEESLRQRDLLEEDMLHRADGERLQAQQPDVPGHSARR